MSSCVPGQPVSSKARAAVPPASKTAAQERADRGEADQEVRLQHRSRLEDLTSRVPAGRLVGQLVMAGMTGTRPTADLLERVRQGEIGGVIIFAGNVDEGLSGALDQLQQAARQGGNPPLLIATDQEGGAVRRLPGPPDSPRTIATAEEAARQGEATGTLLAGYHVNVDLAPVADLTRSAAGFEARQGRGFAGGAQEVAERSDAFAQGLQRRAIAATAKHFPGIGSLTASTDDRLGQVSLGREEMEQELIPFRRLVDHGVEIVMVANAEYPALDPAVPAVFSPAIVQGLLRQDLGFRGLVITDDLGNTPGLPGDAAHRAVMAVQSGADVVLYAPPEDGPVAYQALLAAVDAGTLSRTRAEGAYRHVLALKARLAR